MSYYFRLQYRMLNRHISEFGLNPYFGYVLAVIGFIGFSEYLFFKTSYAEYIYAILGISIVINSSESKRNAFLKSQFSTGDYHKIRLLENTILTFPFVIFLLYKSAFLVAVGALLATMILVFINFNRSFRGMMPTPFSRRPFEFSVGFRKTFALILFAYFLTGMAMVADNFNLGIFSIILVVFTTIFYYISPENKFFVWIYNTQPKAFLFQKIKTALWYCLILCLPIMLTLSFFFPNKIIFVIAALLLGYCYLITIILAKYAVFPGEINLPQGILIAIGIWLPPFLIGIIPFFYKKSLENLKPLLP